MTTCYDGPVYYYYKPTCKLAEEMLQLLPHTITYHREMLPEVDYIPFKDRITFCKDSVPPIVYSFIHYLFRPHCKPCSGKKVYIARKSNRPRYIVNQEELINALPPDFQAVYLEDYSVKEQIELVSEANVVIGPHGAGLAYTVFCQPGALVIEILGEPLGNYKHYRHLCDGMGHSFIRFDRVSKLENEHMCVDIPAFTELLTHIAGPQCPPQSESLAGESEGTGGRSDPSPQSQAPP